MELLHGAAELLKNGEVGTGRLYLVTCDYVFGLDYGISIGLVGIFYTRKAAEEARQKTLEMWNDHYMKKSREEWETDQIWSDAATEFEESTLFEDNGDDNDWDQYVRIFEIEPGKYYSASVEEDGYLETPTPDVLIGWHIE